MQRTYASVANFRGPFTQLPFAGLGDAMELPPLTWPRKRSYQELAWFRAPYSSNLMWYGSLQGSPDGLGCPCAGGGMGVNMPSSAGMAVTAAVSFAIGFVVGRLSKR